MRSARRYHEVVIRGWPKVSPDFNLANLASRKQQLSIRTTEHADDATGSGADTG